MTSLFGFRRQLLHFRRSVHHCPQRLISDRAASPFQETGSPLTAGTLSVRLQEKVSPFQETGSPSSAETISQIGFRRASPFAHILTRSCTSDTHTSLLARSLRDTHSGDQDTRQSNLVFSPASTLPARSWIPPCGSARGAPCERYQLAVRSRTGCSMAL